MASIRVLSMSEISAIQLQMIALFDADLEELRSVCEILRGLGDGGLALRLERIVARNQELCDEAWASLRNRL